MAHLTTADLKEMPSNYESSRNVDDVLLGEDEARPIIEASSSGDLNSLQSLLLQPRWIKIALDETHTIYSERSPSRGPDHVRIVSAMRFSNVQRALFVATKAGQGAVVSELLGFAAQQGLKPSQVVSRFTINKLIDSGSVGVLEALAAADPDIVNVDVDHGRNLLFKAVRNRDTDLVAALLRLGADPVHPCGREDQIYRPSLLYYAAMTQDTRILELLLSHHVPIARSSALHSAARCGRLETMRLLMGRGADVNEVLSTLDWTPLHYAASDGETGAMQLLKDSGARVDATDRDGKTAAQLLDEHKLA